jgi:hypothetical protein
VTGAQTESRSLLRYSPALVLVAIAAADAGRFADPDLWGHIHFGQDVLNTLHLTRHDPYSYSAARHVWNDHEWLTEVVLAFSYGALGVAGLKLMKFFCTAATIILLARGESETGAPETMQFCVLIASAIALGPELQFRPQLFTFIFLSATLWMLARDNYGSRAHLWLMVPIMVLWVNFHGGFFIGLVTLCVYTAVAVMRDLYEGRGWNHGVKLVALTICAALATLVTPYGFENWYAVTHTLHNPITRNLVQEWEPLLRVMSRNAHSGHSGLALYLVVLGMMAAFAITVALTPRLEDFPLVAIAVVMTAAAFLSVRNMALAIIAISGPLTRHVSLVAERMRAGRATDAGSRGRGTYWLANQILLTVIAVVLMLQTDLFSSRLPEGIAYPASAVAFMKDHDLHGNLLGDFNWGEYLIFHMTPESKVFIDSRYDLVYPQKVIQDYATFYFGLPGANAVIDSYPHEFVLIPPDCPAYRVMTARTDWKLVYRDQNAALFARAGSPSTSLPHIPVLASAPQSYFP